MLVPTLLSSFGDFLDETMQTKHPTLEYIKPSYFLINHEESETEDIGSRKSPLEDEELEVPASENDLENDRDTNEDSNFSEVLFTVV